MSKIKKNIISFIKKDLIKFPNNINFTFLLLVAYWFIKEITGKLFFEPKIDFIINLIVIFFALLVFKNSFSRKEHVLPSFKNIFNIKKDYQIVIIIILFLALMLSVINWDLPYHYHPGDDEYVVPSALMSNGEFNKTINNPNESQNPLYDNQHLMYYILTPFFFFFKSVGLHFYPNIEPFFAPYFFLARILNYGFASVLIFLTYLIGKTSFNKKTGLLAATLLATSKLLMHYAMFMRSDVILTTLITLFFFIFVTYKKEKSSKHMLLGGILGLALSLKPYALLFMLPILVDSTIKLYRKNNFAKELKLIATSFSSLLLLFHFGRFYNHYILQRFGAGFYNAISHATTGHYGLFPSAGMGHLKKMFFGLEMISWWQGKIFVLLFIVSILFSIYTLKKKRIIVLPIMTFFIFLYFSSNIVQAGKFYLIILPVTTIIIADFIIKILSKKNIFFKIVTFIFVLLFFCEMLFLSVGKLSLLQKNDIRLQTINWTNNNLEHGSSIMVIAKTSWQIPSIDRINFKKTNVAKNAKYLIIPSSDLHLIEYYLKNKNKFKKTDWLPREEPTEEELYKAKNIYDRKLTINNTVFKKIKTIQKKQLFLRKTYNEYFEHPASWELWAVNNPKAIFIYENTSN